MWAASLKRAFRARGTKAPAMIRDTPSQAFAIFVVSALAAGGVIWATATVGGRLFAPVHSHLPQSSALPDAAPIPVAPSPPRVRVMAPTSLLEGANPELAFFGAGKVWLTYLADAERTHLP